MSRIPHKVKSPEQALEQSMRTCFQDITRELKNLRSKLRRQRYDDPQGMRPREPSRFDHYPPQMSHSTYYHPTFNELEHQNSPLQRTRRNPSHEARSPPSLGHRSTPPPEYQFPPPPEYRTPPPPEFPYPPPGYRSYTPEPRPYLHEFRPYPPEHRYHYEEHPYPPHREQYHPSHPLPELSTSQPIQYPVRSHLTSPVIPSEVEPILPTILWDRCASYQDFGHEAVQCPNSNTSQGETKENCGKIEEVVYEPPPECLYFDEEEENNEDIESLS